MNAKPTPTPVTVRSLIAGRWTDGDSEPIETTNPATAEPSASVRQCTPAQAEAAVAAARVAHRSWADAAIPRRTERLLQLRSLLAEHSSELARAVTTDTGKTLRAAREEIEGALRTIEEGVADIGRQFGTLPPSTSARATGEHAVSKRLLVTYVPVGVVTVITTWNFPVGIAAEQRTPPLGFGNTVIWKPSEVAPTSSQLVTELLVEAGVPPGVINVVHGGGDVGSRMVEHPHVDMVSFVGSIRTGEQIARMAGVKQLLLELGGNGPLVVMEDADLDAAVEATVDSAFYLTGQVCTAAERVLVQSTVHDEFVARLLARTRRRTRPAPRALSPSATSARYDGREVRHDVSGELRVQECLALVGESGSGKTTLSRAIVGLVEPTGGSVVFEGQQLSVTVGARSTASRRRLQYVFQSPYTSLNRRKRTGEILSTPLRHFFDLDRREILGRAAAALARVELPDTVLARYPHELSGGERQRVTIARALACEPAALIRDEVTSALDVSVQAAIAELLRGCRARRGSPCSSSPTTWPSSAQSPIASRSWRRGPSWRWVRPRRS